jgi:Zn-dependent protease with chaperone function
VALAAGPSAESDESPLDPGSVPRVWRRPAAVTLLALIPLALLWLYGAARVAAPFGVLGLLFDHPWDFGLAAGAASALSVVLMAIPRVDRAVGRVLLGGDEPEGEERARLQRLLGVVGTRAQVDPGRFHLLIQDHDGLNAAAGGSHLVFVTRGALRLPDEALAAILAHELGHHRDGFPVATALIWWARLPALPIRLAARAIRSGIAHLTGRLRSPLHWLGVALELVVVLVQLNLLWLVYAAEVIAAWLGRISEFSADRHAARWGFGTPLAAALAAISDEGERGTRLDRLLDEHPPLEDRLRRLSGSAGDDG